MKYKRLAKFFGYVVSASQTLRPRNGLATEIMTFIPTTTGSRLGLASTFILGAAVGNQLQKHRDRVTQFTHEERRSLHVAVLSKSVAIQKQCDIISKLHKTLLNYQTSSCVGDSATSFYIDKAKKLCHTYLNSWGKLEYSAEISLENWYEESEWIDSTDYWAKLPALRTSNGPSYSSTLLASVTALWHISTARDRCRGKGFVDADLLQMLKQIIDEKVDSVAPFVLKILANISAAQENYQILHDAGMIEVLKTFAENSHSELFLPAWRGLHNLKERDGKMATNQEVYVEGVYPFTPPYFEKAEDPVLDVILVHGVRGGASWTWRQHDQEKFRPLISQEQRKNILNGQLEEVDALYTCCWPLDWLMPSLNIPVRILAVDYTAKWQTSMDRYSLEACGKSISQHATDIAESLKAAKVGDRPIVWISHSMGGLIVKHMLVDGYSKESPHKDLPKDMHILQEDSLSCNTFARQSLGVVFFSVPHHGSLISSYLSRPLFHHVFQPSEEVRDMTKGSPTLTKVHEAFVDIVQTHNTTVLTLNENQPILHKLGLEVYFVPAEYGDPGIGTFHEVDANHLDICKPLNRKSETFQKVAAFFKDLIKNL